MLGHLGPHRNVFSFIVVDSGRKRQTESARCAAVNNKLRYQNPIPGQGEFGQYFHQTAHSAQAVRLDSVCARRILCMATGLEVYLCTARAGGCSERACVGVCAVITRDSLLTIEMLNPAQWRMILWINQPLHTLPRAAAFNAAPAKCCLLSRYKYVRENGCKLHTNT
jgi:hypothetical protein